MKWRLEKEPLEQTNQSLKMGFSSLKHNVRTSVTPALRREAQTIAGHTLGWICVEESLLRGTELGVQVRVGAVFVSSS